MNTWWCEGAIFDLDGVITGTAKTHFTAWKETFEDFLANRLDPGDEASRPFTYDGDYVPYVDGKPRYDGVRSFLESRGISLPEGSDDDGPEAETVRGVGNAKNLAFRRIVERDGVEIYDSTVKLVEELRDRGVQVGVASSSKNARFILETTGLLDLFGTVVDGVTSVELGLKGKPAPDIFLTAAERLSVHPERSLMVEDAFSGVEAGVNGNFALVIGVARGSSHEGLKERGAHVVVSDLADYSIIEIESYFRKLRLVPGDRSAIP